jgi:hypothetical protein
VTLFSSPGSRSAADFHEVLSTSHEHDMQSSLHEVDHVSRVFAALDEGAAGGHPYDLLHDHCGFTAVAMADRISVPVVHTLQRPFTPETIPFYLRHGGKAQLVAISGAQRATAPDGVTISAVVPNPIDVNDWPFEPRKQDYLLWLGHMTPVNGPHRAIAVARAPVSAWCSRGRSRRVTRNSSTATSSRTWTARTSATSARSAARARHGWWPAPAPS